MADRAISEVLGYALIFALIVSMVGMVYTTGVGGLQDTREFEKLSNAERAFDVLDSNIADVTRGTAQVRGTEVKLHDSSLGLGEPVAINVSVDGEGSYRGTIQPLYYAGTDDGRVVSSNGAIFREFDDGVLLRSEPAILVGEQTVVPIIVTQSRDTSIAGSGRVLVRTSAVDRSVVHFPAADTDANITIDSPRAAVWADHLSSDSRTSCDVSGDVATCTVDTDEVYVQIVRVDVSLI